MNQEDVSQDINMTFVDFKGQTTEVFDKMLNVLRETKKFTSVELIEMASTNILTGIGKKISITIYNIYIYVLVIQWF